MCENKKSKGRGRGRKIGKVGEAEDLVYEIAVATFLKTIPGWKNYFVLPNDNSFCVTSEHQVEKDVETCEILKKYKLGEATQISMPFGGKDVYDTLISVKIVPKKFDIFAFVRHLLEAGTLMALHGFIHYDLHSGNVLLDGKYTPKLIDFGESFRVRDIDEEFVKGHWKVFDASFGPEPPEITIATGVRKGVPFEEVFREVLQEKDTLQRAEILLGLGRREQAQQFRLFWETSRAARDGDWVALWKTYWPMFDSWALGTLFIDIVRRVLMTGGVLEGEKSVLLQEVLTKMVQMSPRERIDCVEALSLFDPLNELLQGGDAQRWLEKRQRERAAARAAPG